MTHPEPRLARSAVALLLALACRATASAAPADPTSFEYEFGADAIAAGFFNSDAWFGESQAVLGAEVDSWYEFGFEPRVSFQAPLGTGLAFGQLSAVWTYTAGDDASGLTIGAPDTSEVTIEQANLGWRKKLDLGGSPADFSVSIGRQDYLIGSGLLVADGGGDGAERGGWYISMRKSFGRSILLRLENDRAKAEAFRIENMPRFGGVEGSAVGGNAELKLAHAITLGATAMGVDTNLPAAETLHVLSARFDLAPETGFGANAELVTERNDSIDADGGFVQLRYAAADLRWSPTFSARYAAFSGDDPLTPGDERFREIAYGYTDYGSWFQGEITGNYPLGNGNLRSLMLRMEAAPAEGYTLNVIYYRFALEHPASLDPTVTADDWGDEIDVILDVEVTDRWYLIGVLGVLMPGDAAKQWTGGASDWAYSMISLSYAW